MRPSDPMVSPPIERVVSSSPLMSISHVVDAMMHAHFLLSPLHQHSSLCRVLLFYFGFWVAHRSRCRELVELLQSLCIRILSTTLGAQALMKQMTDFFPEPKIDQVLRVHLYVLFYG